MLIGVCVIGEMQARGRLLEEVLARWRERKESLIQLLARTSESLPVESRQNKICQCPGTQVSCHCMLHGSLYVTVTSRWNMMQLERQQE